MDLGSWTRRTGFWAVDALKGSPYPAPLRRHPGEDGRAGRRGRAAGAAPGARHAHDQLLRSPRGPGLADFPVIDRAFCRQHIGELRSSAFTDGQLRSVSTSGSTGTPLTVHQDRSKRQRTVADLIYVHEAAGLALGEKLMWIHEWSSVTAKSRLGALLQNVVSVRQATLDGRGEDEVIVRLRRDRVRGLLAYGSELWSWPGASMSVTLTRAAASACPSSCRTPTTSRPVRGPVSGPPSGLPWSTDTATARTASWPGRGRMRMTSS